MTIINKALIQNDWKVVEGWMLQYIPSDCNEDGEIDRFLRDMADGDQDHFTLNELVRLFLDMWLQGIYDTEEGGQTVFDLCDKNDTLTMVKLFEMTVGDIEEESLNATIVLQRMLPGMLQTSDMIDAFLQFMVEGYAHDEIMTKERLVGAYVCWYTENELDASTW
jgi:hypothetical protein